MSGPVREWLPVEAVERAAVRGPVAAAVDEWSRHWLAAEPLRLTGWSLAQVEPRPDAEWRDFGGGFALGAPSRATERLAGLALDRPIDSDELTGRDRKLLDGLTRRILDDLVARVRRVLGADPKAARPAGRSLLAAVGDDAGAVICLAIPSHALLGLARRSLPPARTPATPVSPRRGALGRAPVRLDVSLGSVNVSLADVRGLAVGDVLVLDRKLGEAADVRAANEPAVLARGLVSDAEGGLALILQSSE